MTGDHFVSATPASILAPAPCTPLTCSGSDLGGMVLNDNNADGIHQAGETVGVPGVTITVFGNDGSVYSTTSDGTGRYNFGTSTSNPIPGSAYPIRAEFTGFPGLVLGNSGPSLNGNHSSVCFLNSSDCSLDCGAVNPLNYSQSNPPVFTNLFCNNDPLGGGSAGTPPGLIVHDYNSNSDYTYNTLANSAAIGSVWGKAWNKFKKKLIVSAFLKRHSGFGPLGIGGLYLLDYNNPGSPVFSNFLDLTTLGVDLG